MFRNDSDLLRPLKSDFEKTFFALKAETPYLELKDYMELLNPHVNAANVVCKVFTLKSAWLWLQQVKAAK